MADEPKTPQAGADQGQAGGQAPSAGADSGSASKGSAEFELDGEKFDPERAIATIRKLREFEKQAKTQGKELDSLRTSAKAAEDAKLSENERLTKRLADLERQNAELQRLMQERVTRYRVQLQAASLNVVDPEAAYLLLDHAALEFDENGEPTNIEKMLRELVKTKPYLVQAKAAPPDINAGAKGKADPNQLDDARVKELRQRYRF